MSQKEALHPSESFLFLALALFMMTWISSRKLKDVITYSDG